MEFKSRIKDLEAEGRVSINPIGRVSRHAGAVSGIETMARKFEEPAIIGLLMLVSLHVQRRFESKCESGRSRFTDTRFWIR